MTFAPANPEIPSNLKTFFSNDFSVTFQFNHNGGLIGSINYFENDCTLVQKFQGLHLCEYKTAKVAFFSKRIKGNRADALVSYAGIIFSYEANKACLLLRSFATAGAASNGNTAQIGVELLFDEHRCKQEPWLQKEIFLKMPMVQFS